MLATPALVLAIRYDTEAFFLREPRLASINFSPGLWLLFRLSFVLSGSWMVFFLALTVTAFVPFIVRTAQHCTGRDVLSLRRGNSLRYALMIRHYPAFCLAAFAFWQLVVLLTPPSMAPIESPSFLELANYYWSRGAFAVLLLSVMLLIEKILLQRLARNYHEEYYEERLEANSFAMGVLRRLRKTFPLSAQSEISSTMAEAIGSTRDPVLRELQTLHTAKVALSIFRGMQQQGREYLILRDMERTLRDPLVAKQFFALLDRDDNGDLTQREMLDGVRAIYEEYELLQEALVDTDDLLGRVDVLGLFLVLFLTLVLCLPIFDISIAGSLISVIATVVAIDFIFSDSIESIYDTLLFVFVSHPFDVGDAVLLGGTQQRLIVKSIGWWNSSFYGNNNQLVYLSNSHLSKTTIANLRRSGAQGEDCKVAISLDTTRQQILQLERSINDFIMKNPRDYEGTVIINIVDLTNSECMHIQMGIPYKSNLQDDDLRSKRHLRFMQNLRIVLLELGIKLAKTP